MQLPSNGIDLQLQPTFIVNPQEYVRAELYSRSTGSATSLSRFQTQLPTRHENRDVNAVEHSCRHQSFVHEGFKSVGKLLSVECHNVEQDSFDIQVVRVLIREGHFESA